MSPISRTVLIVDDSPEDRELYRRYLLQGDLQLDAGQSSYTYILLEATLGQEGLDLWQEHQPDAVLLDYRLPDLDGLEFLSQLQSSTQQMYLPVIVVTGQGNEAIAVQAMKAGAQDYLIKEQITPAGLHLAISGAIATVQLHTQLQQRIERERVVAQITRQIRQTLDLEEILQTTVTEVRQFLQTDRVLVFRLQPDGNGTVMSESVGSEWRSLLSISIYDPCLAGQYLKFSQPESVSYDPTFVEDYVKRYRQGHITAIADIQASGIDPCHIELLAQFQVKANLVVPILHDDQFWGLLIAHHCTAPRSWQPLEIDLLRELATQVSIALRQADLYQQTQNELAERQQVEAGLRESEERFRQLAENIDVVFWLREASEPRVSYVSPAYERLWGWNPQELYESQQAWVDHIHPDDRASTDQAFHEKAALGQFDQEYRIILADGSLRWVHDRCFPLRDQTGEIYRFAGIAEDITDRKQNEEILRQSEERYRTLFESMNEGFCLIEMLFDEHNTPLDYRFLEINPAFEQQTGLKQAEGKTARQLLPELEQYWFQIYGHVALTGEPIRFENCSNVMNRWFEVSAFRVGRPENRKVAILFKDITERKQFEQEREYLLTQEQTARAEAERANRIKDEFLAVLSHELRSPLNPILGWTKLMQTRKFDATKTAEALATIERNAKLQTQMIDELLDVAKILRGKLSMETAPVDLVFVIESAIDTVRTAAVARSILLHPVLPQIGQVLGDAARLQQIIWNLLSNAIKFTPEGGLVNIELSLVTDQAALVEAQSQVTNGNEQMINGKEKIAHYAQITVSDTGKGIDPDFLPYIFESFRQEDASTTRKYGGLGLGLAIVRQLVEAHGGIITADSLGEGLGATFTVQLPLLNTEPAQQSIDQLPPHDLDLTGIRILVVDDEPDARDLLTVLLFQYGAQALIVTSAAEVMANLESFQPDVLVSDIGMPKVDGYTLIQQIRALPPAKGGQIPAIALTAYARGDDYDRAISSGYQRHITKPLDPEQLVQAVLALVQRQLKFFPSSQ
jgi:PAS domain S-box-containing protein